MDYSVSLEKVPAGTIVERRFDKLVLKCGKCKQAIVAVSFLAMPLFDKHYAENQMADHDEACQGFDKGGEYARA